MDEERLVNSISELSTIVVEIGKAVVMLAYRLDQRDVVEGLVEKVKQSSARLSEWNDD